MSRDALEVRPGFLIPDSELLESASRSRGPGGQNVNKVSTRVTLRFAPGSSAAVPEALRARLLKNLAARLTDAGELVIQVDETRSQSRNRALARERLAALLRGALARPRPRIATRPTRASRTRRLAAKQRQSARKRSRRERGEPD
jgi:ribosome-associated protein